jgi:ABC-2 type transport system ATP-binding protein
LDLKRQGKTIFLNSHILQEVELVCDRVAILDKGNLKRVANIAEITSGRGGLGGLPAGGIVAGGIAVGGIAGGGVAGGNGQPGQAAEALELHLDLTGPEPTIRETLNGLPISTWQLFGPTDHRVVACVPDQTTVDQLIDRLRSSGVSIVGLTRRRVSLEEAYLEIVSAETVD